MIIGGFGHRKNVLPIEYVKNQPMDSKGFKIGLGYIPYFDNKNIVNVFSGENTIFFLDNNGTVHYSARNDDYCLGPKSSLDNVIQNEIPQIITIPRLKSPIKYISAGYHHCLVMLKDYSIYGFGHNNHGQMGVSERDITTPFFIKINLKDFIEPLKIKKNNYIDLLIYTNCT